MKEYTDPVDSLSSRRDVIKKVGKIAIPTIFTFNATTMKVSASHHDTLSRNAPSKPEIDQEIE